MTMFSTGSVLSLAAIAVDRYQAIINCLQYTQRSKLRYAFKMLGSTWSVALACSLVQFIKNAGNFTHYRSCVPGFPWRPLPYAVLMTVTCFLLPLSIMAFSYFRIILVARQHARRIADISIATGSANINPDGLLARGLMDQLRQASMFSLPSHILDIPDDDYSTTSSNTSTANAVNLGREARATIRLLALISLYLICWCPYIVISVLDMCQVAVPPLAVTVTTWLIFMESAVNPLVYVIINNSFRRALRRLWRKRRPRPTQRKTTHRHVHPKPCGEFGVFSICVPKTITVPTSHIAHARVRPDQKLSPHLDVEKNRDECEVAKNDSATRDQKMAENQKISQTSKCVMTSLGADCDVSSCVTSREQSMSDGCFLHRDVENGMTGNDGVVGNEEHAGEAGDVGDAGKEGEEGWGQTL